MRSADDHPQSVRILIVEDEALVALEIEAILESAGHEVIGCADNPRDAIALAAERKPDIALVDIQLAQGASGIDVAATLTSSGVACLFASGNCPKERGRGIALGCLHKPFSDRTLAAAVRAVSDLMRGTEPAFVPSSMHLY